MSFNIEVESGNSVRLPTAGKYCDRDIIVTATGGGGSDDGSYDEGYEAGQQAEYDRSWDSITANGTRTNYNYAFNYWSGNITPSRKITPTSATDMLRYNTAMTEFPAEMFDFSQSTNTQGLFSNCSSLTEVDSIDVSKSTTLTVAFLSCTALRKLTILNIQEACALTSTFAGCPNLTDVTLTGSVGVNIEIASVNLIKASLVSIVGALSTTKSGLTLKVAKSAVNNAFETSSGASNGSTSEEWLALIDTRSNWTIILV